MGKSLIAEFGDKEPFYEIRQQGSKREYKRFVYFNTIQRNLKYILPVSAVTVTLGILVMLTQFFYLGLALFLCAVFIPVLLILICFFSSTFYLKKNDWYLSSVHIYRVFDNIIYIKSENKKRDTESVVSFERLHRFYDTKESFYIYITKNKSVIISKRNLQEQGIDEGAFIRFFSRRMSVKKMKNSYGLRLRRKWR